MAEANRKITTLTPPALPAAPIPGSGFQEEMLWLVAAMATAGGYLTDNGYKNAQKALHTILGERSFDASTQARLHYALLHPKTNPLDIARRMAEQSRAQLVSASFIENMLTALEMMSTETSQEPESERLYQEIAWIFRKVHFEHISETDAGIMLRLGHEVSDSLASLYHLSKRMLLPVRRLPGLLAPEVSQYNARVAAYVEGIERIARSTQDADLQSAVQAFRRFLVEQPYRIVIAGERKRGKSSLVNALVGKALSPVRETAPETATVIEFRHAEAPDYAVSFLDQAQFSHLDAYLENEKDNTLLALKVSRIREGIADGSFVPGNLLSGITSWEDLPDYVAAGGRYSDFVSRVTVAVPLASLRDGVVIVDTPGLNDVDAFHDYLAYEECLYADGILFVMDARNPGAATELDLLRKVARTGRTVGVIGVLTHTDKLDEEHSLALAVEQAGAFLQEACRESTGVKIHGVAPLNARETMQAGTADKPREPGKDFSYLIRLIQDMMSQDSARNDYRMKRSVNFNALLAMARASLERYEQKSHSLIPDEQIMAMLSAHADHLDSAPHQSIDQARRIVEATARELEAWDTATGRNLGEFRERLALRLMDAVHQEIDAASLGFADPAIWKRFENGQARGIARQAVEEFLDQEKAVLNSWEEKMQLFSAEISALAEQCLEQASTDADALSGMQATDTSALHLLMQTHKHMKALAVFSGGAAAGAATAMTPMLFLLTAGNILSMAAGSPAVLAAVAVAAGAVGFVKRFGNPEKRKADFIRKKQDEAGEYAARISNALANQLGQMRQDVSEAYDLELKRSFMPALESLYYQSAHIRNFLQTLEKIRQDTDTYTERARDQLKALEQTGS